jgi:hypothetical protein
MAETTGQGFRAGRVLSAAWAVYMRNFVPFSTVALVLLLPLPFIQLFIMPQAPIGEEVPAVGVVGGVYAVLTLLLTQLITATVVYGTIQEMRHHSVTTGEALTRGLRLALPVLGVVLVASVAVALVAGVTAFVAILVTNSAMVSILVAIIPGITLFIMFWVAIPVAVVEGQGVIASLRRSIFLTKGNRWRILGLVALLWLVAGLITGAASAVFLGTGAVGVYPYVDHVLTAFFTVVIAVVSAVGYHDLRLLKDGVDVDGIASVFD